MSTKKSKNKELPKPLSNSRNLKQLTGGLHKSIKIRFLAHSVSNVFISMFEVGKEVLYVRLVLFIHPYH